MTPTTSRLVTAIMGHRAYTLSALPASSAVALFWPMPNMASTWKNVLITRTVHIRILHVRDVARKGHTSSIPNRVRYVQSSVYHKYPRIQPGISAFSTRLFPQQSFFRNGRLRRGFHRFGFPQLGTAEKPHVHDDVAHVPTHGAELLIGVVHTILTAQPGCAAYGSGSAGTYRRPSTV